LGPKQKVDVGRLVEELERMVALVTSGRIYAETKFRDTPAHLRRLNDIALSGDGEPTTYPNFPAIVAACAEVRRRHGLHDVKLVLITNATMFHREKVRRGLAILDANHGEIWAKLDAGTAAYYQEVDRTSISFQQILDNLLDAARTRPILIQSLFMRVRGVATPPAEQAAYCQRLCEIVAAGGRIQLVQIHTVARQPTESWVTPLSNEEVDALADVVRQRTGLAVATFYGA
jgi:wyosine [tRNA(Phe)-imidazoG37] synthetase (radical SAM superfamily)